ncbi:MAG: M50 family metallopeptidase [Oscillospiraceae bacterium]|nr:M50 family metallopeptidase [Oscillospiraceae bacterium]
MHTETLLSVLNVIFFNILIPLLILSFFIFVHELGHYLSARAFNVAIKEFAIGMGPKIFMVTRNKIDYAIRAVPMGGALTMYGEDEDSDVENAVSKKPVWQRFIIMSSGSFMNLLLGFIIMSVLVSGADGYYSNKINRFLPNSQSNSSGLVEGDEILGINGKRINIYNDLAYALIRGGKDPIDITIMRNGERIVVKDVKFPTETEGGITYGVVDFEPTVYAKSFGAVVNQTFYQSLSTIDMVWTSFFDLLTGRFGIEEVSGPVGVTQAIGNSAREASQSRGGSRMFLFILAIITMNLGVVNLLPLPALDGGRIVFLIIEFVRRKPLKPEYEGYIHLAGFAMLILFVIFITYKDIMKLIAGQ